MGADRLALRPRRALAGAAVEFGEHRLVRHGRRLHVADARAHVSSGVLIWRGLCRSGRPPFNGRNLRMAGLSRKSIVRGFRLWAMHIAEAVGTARRRACPNNHRRGRRSGKSRMDDVRERFQNLHEFLKAARFNLNRNNWDYIVGGTETETTLARNRQSLDSIAFKPRVLRNVRTVDCSSELFGRKVRLPVLIAPVGGLQHVLGRRRRDRRGSRRRVRHPDDAELGDRAAAGGDREARAGRRSRSSSSTCAATTSSSTTSTSARRTRASCRSSASRSISRTTRGASATW